MQSFEMIRNLHLIIQESSIQNRSPEPTKKKNETLVKRFLKNKGSFETIWNLHPVIQESSSKIEAQNLQKEERNVNKMFLKANDKLHPKKPTYVERTFPEKKYLQKIRKKKR